MPVCVRPFFALGASDLQLTTYLDELCLNTVVEHTDKPESVLDQLVVNAGEICHLLQTCRFSQV